MALYNALLFLHLLAVTVWVGGMFVLHVVVRPVAGELLEPPQRLPFLTRVLGQFLRWVGLAVLVLVLSGLGILYRMRDWDAVSPSIYLMGGFGILMTLVFVAARFGAYPRLRSAVAAAEWTQAAGRLTQIRRLVGANLLLGVVTIGVATLGRLLP